MLEESLRELFDRQTTATRPPVQASIDRAVTDGSIQRRWQRAGVILAPILAAAAVAAIAVTGALSPTTTAPRPAQTGKPAYHPEPAPTLPLAPPGFNPLVQYASFGWLPHDARPAAVTESRSVEFFDAVGPGEASWRLAVFARGDCALRGTRLACRDLQRSQEPIATRSAPRIDGFPAYWDFPSALLFEYARGGWATLELLGPNDQPDRAARTMGLHIATTLRFGGANKAVRFPAQFVGLPAGWAVRSVMTSAGRYGPQEYSFQIAAGARLDAPWFDSTDIPSVQVGPAGQSSSGCFVPAGESQPVIVAGHHVTVSRIPAGREPAEQDLCTEDADGLSVEVLIIGNHVPVGVTTLFAHMRLLGPDPAHWTTRPIR